MDNNQYNPGGNVPQGQPQGQQQYQQGQPQQGQPQYTQGQPYQQYQQGYQQGYQHGYQQQPQYTQYTTQQIYYERPRSNGLGMAGFILSLCGLIFCWVPVLDIILWVLGLVFSIIGLFKAPRGFAVAGLIISLLVIITAIIGFVLFGAALIALS